MWCRIIADVTGRKVLRFSTPEIGAYGAARIAGMGIGIDMGTGDMATDVYVPDTYIRSLYDNKYNEYISIQNKFMG